MCRESESTCQLLMAKVRAADATKGNSSLELSKDICRMTKDILYTVGHEEPNAENKYRF